MAGDDSWRRESYFYSAVTAFLTSFEFHSTSVHASRSIFSLQIGVTALLTVETEVRDSILAAFRANSPNELNLSSAVDLISRKLNTLSRHKLLLATTRFAKVNRLPRRR
ncbi:hypothetical protein YC2023_041528 [Brassica napus]